MTKIAVVTGSNKGIGFGIVKSLMKRFDGVVYLTSRNIERGKAAVDKLNDLGLKPKYHQLDVTDRDSIQRFRNHIEEKHGGIDILVNNAGFLITSPLYNSYEDCKYTIDVNYNSLLSIQEILYPLVRDNGRILNISSQGAHLCNLKNKYWIQILSKKDVTVNDVNEFVNWFLEGAKNGTFNYDDLTDKGTAASYRVAKLASYVITMIQQKELEPKNICVNALHPGYVQTDMSLGKGFYDIDQAAEIPVYLLLEAPQSLKGAFVWYNGKIIDWYDYNADCDMKASNL